VGWNFADVARFLEIVGTNLILSGDNVIVVGLVIRKLPAPRRKIASIAGVAGAAMIQIAATLTAAWVLRLPVVSCIGGVLLAWIAIRLLQNDVSNSSVIRISSKDMRRSILTVMAACLVMCLDNVLAVAAVAGDHLVLLVYGLLLSCALSIPCSLLIADLLKRHPLLITAGAAVLGWTAGIMIVPALSFFGNVFDGTAARILVPPLITIVVITSPWWWPSCECADPTGENPDLDQ
jgi:YjbE family integral membrane protein